jgi:hypothetical protein
LHATVESPKASGGQPNGVLGPVVSISLSTPPDCGCTFGAAFATTFGTAVDVAFGAVFSAASANPAMRTEIITVKAKTVQHKLFFDIFPPSALEIIKSPPSHIVCEEIVAYINDKIDNVHLSFRIHFLSASINYVPQF